ncbi:sterol esterase 2 [[Candida] jaroonii]|uniref:Sterol esterase 2 n=1 Tax=[Candida] jaroonii TaxID=467808 RepID=A0ACA9Y9G8_9ASCO|nr:sterol esterase 2 [[Candida] jaroonii]
MEEKTKKNYHSTFIRYWYIFTSGFLSFWFVAILFICGIFYHLRKLFRGEKDSSLPETEDSSECFPDIKNMKITDDLKYYAKQLSLDLEEFKVTTDDGYILILFRLKDPEVTDEKRDQLKPILLQHGLLSSAGAFLTPGTRSLPYYLVKNGYDVWLGNNRSGFKPLHSTIKGNLMHSEEYWDWDINNLALYDIPCLINNVLSRSKSKKLILLGHSQGCTQSFLMLKNPEMSHIHEKIEWFIGLAPAIFPGILFHKRKFIQFMGNRSPVMYNVFFGVCAFLNSLVKARNLIHSWKLYGVLSTLMFHYLFEWSGKKWNKNKKIWHMHFIFNVSFVSSKLFTWWTSQFRPDSFRNQLVSKKTFKLGHNSRIMDDAEFNVDDSQTFFPFKQQWFTDSVVPMIIFNGDVDNLVDPHRLKTHMENFEPSYKSGETLHIFQVDDYNHLDVIWADDLIKQIGEKLLPILKDIV